MATSQDFVNWVCTAAVVPRWLALLFLAEQAALRRFAKGTTHQTIYYPEVKAFHVCLPPLPEQHRIVAAVDSYLSRLDDAVATLQRVQRNLKRYRASVLQAAVEGRLVPTEADLARAEGRDYEPASVLLERILRERRRRWEEAELAKLKAKGKTPKNEKWKANYKEPIAPDTSDLPALPEGWCWATVDCLLREPLRNGHSARRSTSGRGVRTFTLTAVTVGDFSEVNTKITSASPDHVSGLWAEPGDLFVERANTAELVGTARLYMGQTNYAVFPDLIIRVRLAEAVEARFIEQVLQSSRLRRYFKRAAKGIAGSMPKISQPTVAAAVIPLPPLAEQARTATEVERLSSVITATDACVTRDLRRVTRLRRSILQQAFEGKLVDQDPTDEPAAELLKRIAAERAASALPARRTRRTRRKKQEKKA